MMFRGVKTVEHRSRTTKMIGWRFYSFGARKWAGGRGGHWIALHNAMVADRTADSFQSLAEAPLRPDLPTGVIVDSVIT